MSSEAVHGWFGLTYSAYLVLHRVALQSMPDEWQERFVALLEEMRETIDHEQMPSSFRVMAVDDRGKFISDDWRDYQRGRRKAPLKNGRPRKATP